MTRSSTAVGSATMDRTVATSVGDAGIVADDAVVVTSAFLLVNFG